MSFIDDYARVFWIFLLKHKSDVSLVLPNFHNMIKKNQFDVTIKRFQSNNIRDYFNQVLTLYFQHEGLIHGSLCVNTSVFKGVGGARLEARLEARRSENALRR